MHYSPRPRTAQCVKAEILDDWAQVVPANPRVNSSENFGVFSTLLLLTTQPSG